MRPNVVSTMEARFQAQPCGKHAAPVQRMRFDVRPWLSKKAAASATAVLLSAMLVCPNAAFAAEWIEVGSDHYDSGQAWSGEGWSWDGADDMTLNGYNGGAIAAKGDLNVDLATGSTNTITNDGSVNRGEGALTVDQGDLTISGGGRLNATAETDVIMATGDGATGGDVTIDGAIVNVTATGEVDDGDEDGYVYGAMGIVANGGDVTIANGAQVSVDAGYEYDGTITKQPTGAQSSTGIYATNFARDESGIWRYRQADGTYNKGGNIIVDDSFVHVEAEGAYSAAGMATFTEGVDSSISATNKSLLFIDATCSTLDYVGNAFGIAARSHGDASASVVAKDSTVWAKAYGDSGPYGEGGEAGGVGIYAESESTKTGANIGIDNSSIFAYGSLTAIESVGISNNGSAAAGTISISNSHFIEPKDAAVRDYESARTVYGPQALSDISGIAETIKGQVIGKAGSGVLSKLLGGDAYQSVEMSKGAGFNPAPTPDPEPNPNPDPAPSPAPGGNSDGSVTPGAGVSDSSQAGATAAAFQASASVNSADAKTIKASGSSAMPQTGDATAELGIVASVIAAFTTVTGLFAARKRGNR